MATSNRDRNAIGGNSFLMMSGQANQINGNTEVSARDLIRVLRGDDETLLQIEVLLNVCALRTNREMIAVQIYKLLSLNTAI